jgi:sensor c-di-GMP phosphodiesterase-like protein
LLPPKRTSLRSAAVVLGIVALGAPVVAFNVWLKKQGEDEVSAAATWALASAEVQLTRTVETLRALAARGIDSCRPAHLDAMRQAAVMTAPIKEMMLLASNGQVLCTDTGALIGPVQLVSSASKGNVMLDLVRLPDRSERFLRVRGFKKSDRPQVAALLPSSLLLPQIPVQIGNAFGHARMTLAGGALVAEAGIASDEAQAQGSWYQHRIQSEHYPFAIAVSLARSGLIASYDELRRLGMVVTGAVAIVVLLLALIRPRQHGRNPVAEMTRAIMAEEFVPYYQPVVDIQSGRLLGAEVLARWRRPDGSMLEPDAFVPLMESHGLVLEMTRLLMRRALGDVGEAIGRRPELTIAFNVAPKHFDDALILNDIGTIFGGSPIRLSQIVLELTERHEVADLSGMRRTIAALQGLGCKVAIDDAGTGHSGLSYMLKLGVDIIKIDRIFVEAIGTESRSKAIIETLIDLAANMRMEIVAEGVETFDQVTYLRERGIKAAQGFIFAPALPAATFLRLLDAMEPCSEPAPQGPSEKDRRAERQVPAETTVAIAAAS